MRTSEQKFKTVVDKNTFYFFDREFEKDYEGHLHSIKETLLVLKNAIQNDGLTEKLFEDLLNKQHGLRALLALTGFSNENLKRLVTIVRITDDPELCALVHKNKWHKQENPGNLHEWSDSRITKLIQSNPHFRKGIVNLFFRGASTPFLAQTLPLFELKKLSISKLKFDVSEMVDTLIRYKEKGSRSGKKSNNPENVIKGILNRRNISFAAGNLGELVAAAPDRKRQMDFIIPDKSNPKIVIESSYLSTTSSGQGDKAKTEITVKALLASSYPGVKFIGFVDGIGWYVRKGDLQRMVKAYDDAFTFHDDELSRFEQFLTTTFSA